MFYYYLVSSRSGRDTELQPIKGGSLHELDDTQDDSQDKVTTTNLSIIFRIGFFEENQIYSLVCLLNDV